MGGGEFVQSVGFVATSKANKDGDVLPRFIIDQYTCYYYYYYYYYYCCCYYYYYNISLLLLSLLLVLLLHLLLLHVLLYTDCYYYYCYYIIFRNLSLQERCYCNAVIITSKTNPISCSSQVHNQLVHLLYVL